MDKILMVVIKETGDKRIASRSGRAELLSLLLAVQYKEEKKYYLNRNIVKIELHFTLHTFCTESFMLTQFHLQLFCCLYQQTLAVLLLAIIIQDCSSTASSQP